MAFAASLAEGDQFYQSGQAEAARRAWTTTLPLALTETERCILAGRFLSLGFLTEADEALSLCKTSSPSLIALRSSLALERGDVEASLKLLDDEIARENLTLMSNALLVSHYRTPEDPQDIKAKSLVWAERAAATRLALSHGSHRPEAPRGLVRGMTARDLPKCLRIGFVSGDLCAHPVGFLIAPILKALAAHGESISIFIFDNGAQNDWMTENLRGLIPAAHWHSIKDLDDPSAMRLIADLQLDALVDCSGHTSRSRLMLFAHRLAPLQISWGGYFATTGLAPMDAVIMDPLHASPESADLFVERIVHVPSRFIYAPPFFCPPVTDVPYFRCGTITFGSFNNVAKINSRVIAAWSKILQHAPQSRLVLKWRGFADTDFCSKMRAEFALHGVNGDRIELRPFSIYRDTLAQYRDIDIALDPFPFTGGQTSLDALWMGVPLVTLAGISPVARQGHAFVNLIGKPEWSCTNEPDYIACAVALAADPDRLRAMRFDQRDLIYRSPLCDASAFVNGLLALMHACR